YGPDIGFHAFNYQAFTSALPDSYNGMVGFYGLAYWWSVLTHANLFEAFRFGFYFSVAMIPIASYVAAAILFSRMVTLRGYFFAVGLFFLIALQGLWYLILPLLDYYQSEGFITQLYGLVPFLGLWLTFAVIDERRWRMLASLFLLVMCRYAYALNVGDMAVA